MLSRSVRYTKLLVNALEDIKGIKDVKREDIKVNVVGVNHFTWLTKAQYKDIDIFPCIP